MIGHSNRRYCAPRRPNAHPCYASRSLRAAASDRLGLSKGAHDDHGAFTHCARPHRPGRKPVICGTRLSVEFVIGLMADGWKEADIMTNYPGITHDDVMACLAYARDTLSSEKVFPSAA